MNHLKLYPAYKDSGVSWLGEIPEDWNVLPGRACYKEKKISNAGLKERTVLSLSYGQIVIKPEDKLHGLVPASFETYQIVEPKDIIIRPTDLQNDWVSLRFGLSSHRGIITSAYLCFNTQPVMCNEYGHLLLHTYDLKKVFYGLGSGLRQNLDWRDFKYLPCFVPPLPEQTAIIRYLDYMDRRIRRYINAKKKLIALLNEQKQAFIHQAVTRGLDPNVRLKPSGVEWLGDVPEHWEVVPLKFLSKSIQNGATPPTSEPAFYKDGIIPWYGPSSCGQDIQVGKPVRYLSPSAFSIGKARLLRGPALLVIVIGASAGRMALLSGNGSTNQQITAYELDDERVNPIFVLHQLRGAEHWLRATASTATIQILNSGEVSRLPVAVMSLHEQHRIVRNIKQATVNIDKAIECAKSEISLLREYSTRLIADVVTGELDVRETAATLPGEAEEPDIEVLDENGSLHEGTENDLEIDAIKDEHYAEA